MIQATEHSTPVESLGKASESWLHPTATQLAALAISTGQPLNQIERALNNAFTEITPAKLRNISSKEKTGKIVLHIAAGNVFTAWLHGAVLTLLLGHECWIKPSQLEPIFASLWKESVSEIDPVLGERIGVVPWSESLVRDVDAVVAYGSDETLAEIRNRFHPKPIIGYGHKISVAVMTRSALQTDWSRWRMSALDDIRMFELNGCLSPQLVYIEADALPSLEWGESVEPMPRFVAVSSLDEIAQRITGTPSLSCVGVAGTQNDLETIRRLAGSSDEVRYCFLGEMQRPPLDWKNGGISLADELSRL